jgi:hypothetical protein
VGKKRLLPPDLEEKLLKNSRRRVRFSDEVEIPRASRIDLSRHTRSREPRTALKSRGSTSTNSPTSVRPAVEMPKIRSNFTFSIDTVPCDTINPLFPDDLPMPPPIVPGPASLPDNVPSSLTSSSSTSHRTSEPPIAVLGTAQSRDEQMMIEDEGLIPDLRKEENGVYMSAVVIHDEEVKESEEEESEEEESDVDMSAALTHDEEVEESDEEDENDADMSATLTHDQDKEESDEAEENDVDMSATLTHDEEEEESDQLDSDDMDDSQSLSGNGWGDESSANDDLERLKGSGSDIQGQRSENMQGPDAHGRLAVAANGAMLSYSFDGGDPEPASDVHLRHMEIDPTRKDDDAGDGPGDESYNQNRKDEQRDANVRDECVAIEEDAALEDNTGLRLGSSSNQSLKGKQREVVTEPFATDEDTVMEDVFDERGQQSATRQALEDEGRWDGEDEGEEEDNLFVDELFTDDLVVGIFISSRTTIAHAFIVGSYPARFDRWATGVISVIFFRPST